VRVRLVPEVESVESFTPGAAAARGRILVRAAVRAVVVVDYARVTVAAVCEAVHGGFRSGGREERLAVVLTFVDRYPAFGWLFADVT